jgi:hypothetical protein
LNFSVRPAFSTDSDVRSPQHFVHAYTFNNAERIAQMDPKALAGLIACKER